jgi:hypothetical protein
VQNYFTRICACAVTAILLAACGSDAKSTDTTMADVAIETTVPSDTASTSSDLEGLLVTSLPAGFTQLDDSDVDTGPSDFAKAVSDDGGTDAEEVLTSTGFVSGFQRAWESEDGSTRIVVFLYEFSKAEGAATYRDRVVEPFETDATLTAVPFDVNGIPDAIGRSLTNLVSEGDLAAAVVFSSGVHLVQVAVLGPTDEANQTLAQQVALDQFSRL